MGSTSRSNHHHSRSGRHHRDADDDFAGDDDRPRPGIWRRWRVEIVSAALVGLGVFLLVEPFEIRTVVFGWLAHTSRALVDWLGSLNDRITGLHPSDIVGVSLLIIGVSLVLVRVRTHLRDSLRWNLLESNCPRCDGPLKLGHRDDRDRLLAWFVGLKLRRYHCRKCSWTRLGAKRPSGTRSRHRRRAEEALESTPAPSRQPTPSDGQPGSHADDDSDDGEDDGSPEGGW